MASDTKEVSVMARPLTLWIAIVDGEHARFVQPDSSNALHTVNAVDSASAHLRSRDLGSDRPGRSFESAATAHHAVGQRHDLHVMEKEKFARYVADELNAASAREDFDELLLVAPVRTLREVHEALNPGTQSRLVGTLEKDLVKTPDHQLWPHIKDWVSAERWPPA
jgi:protein required for attachment to host cells